MLAFAAGAGSQLRAQGDYSDFVKDLKKEYNSFLDSAKNDYKSFRDKANNDYAAFLSEKEWVPAVLKKPVPRPVLRDNTVPPTVRPYVPAPDTIVSRPLPVREDVKPVAPPVKIEPVSPIVPVIPAENLRNKTFTLFGTRFNVPVPDVNISDMRPDEKSVGETWRRLSRVRGLDTSIASLLKQRDERNLCDWIFYKMAVELAESLCPGDFNASQLLAAYILNQAGYAARLALDTLGGKVYTLVGCDNIIYYQPYYTVGNVKYYPFADLQSARIVSADFPGTRPMSLMIPREPQLEFVASKPLKLAAVHYPDVSATYTINKNLLGFYDTYPSSGLQDSPSSKWTFYGSAPMSESVRNSLYPVLSKAIEGKSQRDAANILMDFCESIPYAYDNEVWGRDRAFFPDESLYYLKADCEDHALLFVRLVRDLMGLDVAVLDYPRHLAAAVHFTEDVPGDYIISDGRKWVVCDPTIFYAGVGTTMRGMDNTKCRLVRLAR